MTHQTSTVSSAIKRPGRLTRDFPYQEVGNPGKIGVHERAVCERIVSRSFINMTEQQAQSFGAMLKARRKALQLERSSTAERAGMDISTLYRFEHGQILNPDPSKLKALARVLRLRLADVLTAAGYPAVRSLPEPGPYLRAKYRNLPAEQMTALSEEVDAVLRRYGVMTVEGPTDGEDESDQDRSPGGSS
jgi:transcriptional regulator with XRE-family HTH domain